MKENPFSKLFDTPVNEDPTEKTTEQPTSKSTGKSTRGQDDWRNYVERHSGKTVPKNNPTASRRNTNSTWSHRNVERKPNNSSVNSDVIASVEEAFAVHAKVVLDRDSIRVSLIPDLTPDMALPMFIIVARHVNPATGVSSKYASMRYIVFHTGILSEAETTIISYGDSIEAMRSVHQVPRYPSDAVDGVLGEHAVALVRSIDASFADTVITMDDSPAVVIYQSVEITENQLATTVYDSIDLCIRTLGCTNVDTPTSFINLPNLTMQSNDIPWNSGHVGMKQVPTNTPTHHPDGTVTPGLPIYSLRTESVQSTPSDKTPYKSPNLVQQSKGQISDILLVPDCYVIAPAGDLTAQNIYPSKYQGRTLVPTITAYIHQEQQYITTTATFLLHLAVAYQSMLMSNIVEEWLTPNVLFLLDRFVNTTSLDNNNSSATYTPEDIMSDMSKFLHAMIVPTYSILIANCHTSTTATGTNILTSGRQSGYGMRGHTGGARHNPIGGLYSPDGEIYDPKDNELELRTMLDIATEGEFSSKYTNNIIFKENGIQPQLIGSIHCGDGTKALTTLSLADVCALSTQSSAVTNWISSTSRDNTRPSAIVKSILSLSELGFPFEITEVVDTFAIDPRALRVIASIVANSGVHISNGQQDQHPQARFSSRFSNTNTGNPNAAYGNNPFQYGGGFGEAMYQTQQGYNNQPNDGNFGGFPQGNGGGWGNNGGGFPQDNGGGWGNNGGGFPQGNGGGWGNNNGGGWGNNGGGFNGGGFNGF